MANNAIWLEGWTVQALRREPDETIAEATFGAAPDACPKCGVVGKLYRHGTKLVKYRDIPTMGKPLTIHATVPRYRCRECGETFMQPLPDMDTQRRMTPAEYLQKHPKARASSLAHRIARDEKTEQLRRELAQSKSRPWWAFWRKR